MRITNREILIECMRKHAIAAPALKAWLTEARDARWKTTMDIKARYPSADFLAGNRAVINIKGKKYRLVIQVNYSIGIVDIRFANTHAEYSKINAEMI